MFQRLDRHMVVGSQLRSMATEIDGQNHPMAATGQTAGDMLQPKRDKPSTVRPSTVRCNGDSVNYTPLP